MHIEIDGVKISYQVEGAAAGPTIVMSHSLASSSVMWDPQVPRLGDNYRLVLMDTRGHGESDVPEGPYRLAQLADDAIAIIEATSDKPVHWVGLSMGGMIGQFVAAKRPDLLRSLVLCDTSASIPDDAQATWDDRIAAVREGGMSVLAEATIQRWFTPNYLREDPPAIMPIRAQIEATNANGFIGCSQAIRELDNLDSLSSIKLPTLIIVGEDDPGTPVAASEAMHERIEGSQLCVIPKASHLSNVEQAGMFTEVLLVFLAQH